MNYENFVKQILLVLWCCSVYRDNVAFADIQLDNPYRILGVDQKAELQDIRRAYKKLVKEWYGYELNLLDAVLAHAMQWIHLWMSLFLIIRHPDKNSDPEAESKFVEIKKAYELLADTDRRKAFDMHGITNEDAFIPRSNHDYSQYGRFATDSFEEFFG